MEYPVEPRDQLFDVRFNVRRVHIKDGRYFADDTDAGTAELKKGIRRSREIGNEEETVEVLT